MERFKNHMAKSRHVRRCMGGSVGLAETDLEAVKRLVVAPRRCSRSPRRGELHAELCRATHFGELLQNRNVFSVQEGAPR
jgi:hypothetical protein